VCLKKNLDQRYARSFTEPSSNILRARIRSGEADAEVGIAVECRASLSRGRTTDDHVAQPHTTAVDPVSDTAGVRRIQRWRFQQFRCPTNYREVGGWGGPDCKSPHPTLACFLQALVCHTPTHRSDNCRPRLATYGPDDCASCSTRRDQGCPPRERSVHRHPGRLSQTLAPWSNASLCHLAMTATLRRPLLQTNRSCIQASRATTYHLQHQARG